MVGKRKRRLCKSQDWHDAKLGEGKKKEGKKKGHGVRLCIVHWRAACTYLALCFLQTPLATAKVLQPTCVHMSLAEKMKKGGCKRVEAGGEGKKKEGKKKEGQWGPPVHCTLASNVHLLGAVFPADSSCRSKGFATIVRALFPGGEDEKRGV